MKKIIVLFLLCFTISTSLYSQGNEKFFKIQIVDSKNSEPLPFATVLLNKDKHRGLVTNLNGWAEFYLSPNDECIQISYVGYQTKIIDRSQIRSVIKIKAIDVKIGEVVVFPEENPAHRIIKKAVANRKINNPDKIPEYGCKVYNKSIYDYIFTESDRNDTSMNSFIRLFSDNNIGLKALDRR